MCGLAGEVNWTQALDPAATERMVQGVAHRGPDDHGLWLDANRRCMLGHRRLSIIDLSPLGHQPMLDPLTGNAIVFNGEIYNYRELRRQCQVAGHTFQSESDTEVILALYRRHGVDCLRYLRGMFAIALWDAREEQLFFARDRVGKKPLNYALTPDGIIFCSEIHPLACHPSVSGEIDLEALELYLQLQAVPAPWTIYRQIRKLPPAHFGVLDRGGLKLQRYWNLDYSASARLSEDQALEAFESKLTEAVRLRMISDVPIGALLSGGVDSSVVVALMAKLSGSPVRTFSIGFHEEAFNELPYAAQAAEACGTVHRTEIVDGRIDDLLPQVARHYGEPFADSSALPSFRVSEFARQSIKVVLNGDGGDELLGGYPRYVVSDCSIRSGTLLGRALGAKRLVDVMPLLANARSIPARAIRKLAHQVLSPELGGLLMFMGYWNDALRMQLMGRFHHERLLPAWRLRWFEEAFRHGSNPIDRMLWLDNRTYLPDDLLVKMDIATMHCSLEARSPLLDHELIEFCASLPVRYKVQRRTGKYLLKRLAEKYYPRDFVHRRKMGFGIPVADWLRGPLRRHAQEVILDPDLMEPLDQDAVRRSWGRLISAAGAAADAEAGRVWALLMYGQWRQLAREVQ